MAGQDHSGAVLALRDIGCARGGRMLFEGVRVALAAGDALIVTGPNGVGKSSLLRIAAGLLVPVAGIVESRGAVALLTEASALDDALSLGRALAFWAAIDGTALALASVGLGYLADVPVRLLSTGQRRRAAFARVVASGAAIWLLDEPASGLDASAIATLEALIATHRQAGGVVLVATHQPLALPGAQTLALV